MRPAAFLASLWAVATLAATPAAAQDAATTQVPARVIIVPVLDASAAERPFGPPVGYTGSGDHQYSLDLRAAAPATPAAPALDRLRRMLRGEPVRPQPPRPVVVMVFE